MSKFRYFQDTRNTAFGLAATAPLMLLYEVGVYFYHHRLTESGTIEVRNAAEVFLKNILAMFGIEPDWALVVMYLFAMTVVIVLHRRNQGSPLRMQYFGMCLIESLIYAAFLGVAARQITRFMLSLQLPGSAQMVEMMPEILQALGAGVYEEMLFRLIMLGSLLLLFKQLLPIRVGLQALVALIVSSLIFAVFHYVSWETVTWQSFFFRFSAGMILGVIFLTRNFAVAVYTHAFYDILYWMRTWW